MRDWIGFNKDVGSEVMANVGQWNLAVAVRALVEAVEQYQIEQERKSKELPPISPGETYEVILRNGTKLVGSVDERGPMWLEMRDANGKSMVVLTNEVACFVEQSQSA